MADAVIARAFLQRMKFSEPAANEAIDKEGLDSIDELAELNPKRCEKIVDRIVKPGGLDAAGQPNRGIYVPERAITNLTHASHLAKMWKRCQRPYTLANINLGDDLATARRQMELEIGHKNDFSSIVPLTNKDLGDRNFFDLEEEIREIALQYRHSTGVSVGGVLRNDLIPKPHNQDHAANYSNHDDEAVARMEIVLPAHAARPAHELEESKTRRWNRIAIECNNICFNILWRLFKDTRFSGHISIKMQRERDGRAAMIAIKLNVCGPNANEDLNHLNRQRADASSYDGEKKNYGWTKHVAKLRRIFKIQEGLETAEPRKYHAFSETEKVAFLKNSCHSVHCKVGISTVIANPHLRNDFEQAQVHIWQMAQQSMGMEKIPARRNVSETRTGRGGRGARGDRGGGGRGGGGRGGGGGPPRGPWDVAGGRFDMEGINAGKYDGHLNKFRSRNGSYSDAEYKKLHPMIKRKRYLETHNADGSKKPRDAAGGAAGGNDRRIAELEASLAESQGVVKGLEMQLTSNQQEEEQQYRPSGRGNDALVPYGHTRTALKKQGRT